MPRTGPRRIMKGIKLSDHGIAEVQRVADRDGVNWSEAARRLIAYGTWKMPPGWNPGRSEEP